MNKNFGSKLLAVAREELAFHLRQWTFYLTALGMPLLFAAVGLFPQLRAAAAQSPMASVETIFSETTVVTVPTGYVDRAGIIKKVPEKQAETLYPFAEEAGANEALQDGEIESYYVIDPDYLSSGAVRQVSSNPQLLSGGDDVIQRLLRENLLNSLESDLARRVNQPVAWVRRGPPPAAFSFIPSQTDLQQLTAAGLVLLLFTYLINIGGSLILRSLQREVQASVLEVLIVSTTPLQLIGGKLLGLTLLTVGQGTLALGAAALIYGRNTTGLTPAELPLSFVALSLPYLLFGYVIYCGSLMGLATIWPNLPESGTLLATIRLVLFTPLIGVLFILPNPDSPLAIGLTLFPLTASLLMPFRLLLSDVALSQWAAGLLLLLLTATFAVWLSARLFRMQSLLTGRSASPRMLWAALRG